MPNYRVERDFFWQQIELPFYSFGQSTIPRASAVLCSCVCSKRKMPKISLHHHRFAMMASGGLSPPLLCVCISNYILHPCPPLPPLKITTCKFNLRQFSTRAHFCFAPHVPKTLIGLLCIFKYFACPFLNIMRWFIYFWWSPNAHCQDKNKKK